MCALSALTILLLLSSSLSTANGNNDAGLKVDIYEGPTDCSNDDKVEEGNYIKIHFDGKIDESSTSGTPGTIFDSSRDRGHPFGFRIGLGLVVAGWDQGIMGLCKNAKAKILVPPHLAYGDEGAGETVPPGATVLYDVEIVSISKKPPSERETYDEIDANGDGYLSREEIIKIFFEQGAADGLPDGLFEQWDKNGDGKLSWEEFRDPNADDNEQKQQQQQQQKVDGDELLNNFGAVGPDGKMAMPFDMFDDLDDDAKMAMLKSLGLGDLKMEDIMGKLEDFDIPEGAFRQDL